MIWIVAPCASPLANEMKRGQVRRRETNGVMPDRFRLEYSVIETGALKLLSTGRFPVSFTTWSSTKACVKFAMDDGVETQNE